MRIHAGGRRDMPLPQGCGLIPEGIDHNDPASPFSDFFDDGNQTDVGGHRVFCSEDHGPGVVMIHGEYGGFGSPDPCSGRPGQCRHTGTRAGWSPLRTD